MRGISNEKSELTEILNDVKTGKLSVDGAVDKIKLEPFQDIGYAKVDTQRSRGRESQRLYMEWAKLQNR